jgi:adenylate cyclase
MLTDIVGYSRLIGLDEEGTIARQKAHHEEVLAPKIAAHGGRIVNTTGDGLLVEFPSVVDAVNCAVEVQTELVERDTDLHEDRRIHYRIGINLGDIVIDGDDILGDGVNIAARLEGLSMPGGICISGPVHDQLSGKLDAVFEDAGEQTVKNILRPVRVWRWRSDQAERGSQTFAEASTLPDKPSIAVLPFANMSGDPEQEYFADGMTEDIITEESGALASPANLTNHGPSIAVLPFDNMSDDRSQEYLADGIVEDIITGLSRVRQFFVIARNSTFTYKGKATDVRSVGNELGVTYVLEGSVRKHRERVRVTAQLVDAGTGHHIWVDRFDGELTDIFDLQDQVTSRVIGAVQPTIRSAEAVRARRKRPDSLVAYDLYMQALPYVSALTREDNQTALGLLNRAMELEGGFVSALSMAAWCHAQRCVYSWTDDRELESNRAIRLADEAVAHAGDDSFALAMLGAAHTLVRDFDVGRRLLEHAVEVNPNCAWSWNRLGWLNGYSNNPKASIYCFERAIRLSPLDPMNFNCHVGIGAAHFLEKNYPEAIRWMEKGLGSNPGARWILRQLVPAYVFAGMGEGASRSLALLTEEYPGLTCKSVRRAMLYSEEVMDQICSGLEQAGLPVA